MEKLPQSCLKSRVETGEPVFRHSVKNAPQNEIKEIIYGQKGLHHFQVELPRTIQTALMEGVEKQLIKQ